MAASTARLTGPCARARLRQASAAAGKAGLTVEIVTDRPGFLALQADWDALFARSARPGQVFQSHVFLRHWAAHYLEDGTQLAIIAARHEGRLVMVWPLMRQRRLGFDTLRFMGLPVAQFGDVLVERDGREAAWLAAGWDALRSLGADLLELRRLRADAVLALPDEAGAVALERRAAPFADLELRVGPDGPGSIYAARERSNYRRRLRRLDEHGEIGFSSPQPGPEAAGLAMQAIAMKQATLDRNGTFAPAITDPRFAAFFRDLAGDCSGTSPLRLTVIHCGETAIGIDIALDCAGTSFGHVIATHPAHQRGGIGSLLIHRSFAAARARGSARFDLLAPADAYKLEHADGSTAVVDWLVPLSVAGRLVCGLGLEQLRPMLRAAVRRLPAPVTRRLANWSHPTGKG